MAQKLDPSEIIETVELLQRRIVERFPEANLGEFCGEVLGVARKAELRTAWIRRPILVLRIAVSLLILGFLSILIRIGLGVAPLTADPSIGDFVQSTEAFLSTSVIVGAGAVFLASLELRIKRRRALAAIHELREMAHIVDMHQLTKDPAPPKSERPDTESSPDRSLSSYELSRYLDYCSEMLALLSKIGALYARDLNDAVVLAGVDSLQGLVDGLSQKVWNKMNIVNRASEFSARESSPRE
ncbi:MAG: hypothetical protein GY725_14660 [bacterium]|nr:hypothetical protein [bacterium]